MSDKVLTICLCNTAEALEDAYVWLYVQAQSMDSSPPPLILSAMRAIEIQVGSQAFAEHIEDAYQSAAASRERSEKQATAAASLSKPTTPPDPSSASASGQERDKNG